jgi:hypothetical protein
MQVTVQSAFSEGMTKRSSGKKEPLYTFRGNERRQGIEIWPTGMSPTTGTGGLGPVYIIIIIIIIIALVELKLHTLCIRRHRFDALLFVCLLIGINMFLLQCLPLISL